MIIRLLIDHVIDNYKIIKMITLWMTIFTIKLL